MKNKIKAAVSLLLSLLLALGCMGTSAFADATAIEIEKLTESTQKGSITVEQNLNVVEQLGITECAFWVSVRFPAPFRAGDATTARAPLQPKRLWKER